MGEDFQQFLSGKIERIQRGADPLLEGVHEILRRSITEMQAGDQSAFHSYAGILKALVEQRLAPDAIRPEWSQTLSNWVTESATKASRRNVRTPDDLLGQLTDQLDRLVSGLRSLENLQTRITRTKPPIGSGLITGLAKLPKSMISGDFIDIFGEGAWTWIVLGDAAGHGLTAAYYANTIFPVLRSVLKPHMPLVESIQTAHRQIYRHRPDSGFEYAVAHIGAWNSVERRLWLVNAGVHNAMPILMRGGIVERLRVAGSQLGLIENASFDTAETTMHPGDFVVFVSDGITEQPSSDDEQFGEDRLVDLVSQNKQSEPDKLAECILSAVLTFGVNNPGDDMTVLVVRF